MLTFIINALILIILIVVHPLISIWAVNTLFRTNIPYDIKTWFAALWVVGLIAGSSMYLMSGVA